MPCWIWKLFLLSDLIRVEQTLKCRCNWIWRLLWKKVIVACFYLPAHGGKQNEMPGNCMQQLIHWLKDQMFVLKRTTQTKQQTFYYSFDLLREISWLKIAFFPAGFPRTYHCLFNGTAPLAPVQTFYLYLAFSGFYIWCCQNEIGMSHIWSATGFSLARGL